MEAEVARLEHGHPSRAPASEHRAWLICRLALVVGDAVEAEDVAEQTLLRASDQPQLPDGSDVLPRLMVDGIRHAIDEGRRRRSSFFAIRETDEDWARTADPELWRAWSGLDRRTRAALVLSVLDGDSETGVAEILGVPPATVTTWRSRGKAGLLDVVAPSQATDTFDADLRARLLALERAVPVAPEPAPVAPVSRPTPRAPLARSTLLAAAVGIAVVAAIAFAIPGRGGPPAASPVVPPVTSPPAARIAAPADQPPIRLVSPMSAYHDLPCGPAPAPPHCATPLPTVSPKAAKNAVSLEIWTVEIPIDHAGDYSIGIGDAILPNGILSEASATLADNRRSDVLIPDGVHLVVIGDDRHPLVNAYRQGWRPGTERVHVRLAFTVESFDPGAALYITDVRVR